jgi:hypothetical protein
LIDARVPDCNLPTMLTWTVKPMDRVGTLSLVSVQLPSSWSAMGIVTLTRHRALLHQRMRGQVTDGQALQRAEARANRKCEVCGEPIDAADRHGAIAQPGAESPRIEPTPDAAIEQEIGFRRCRYVGPMSGGAAATIWQSLKTLGNMS